MTTALYTNQSIRQIESHVIGEGILDEYTLMQTAGQAAFQAIESHWPDLKTMVVCVGRGNNGGDGLVVARLAQAAGYKVTVYTISDASELKGCAAKAYEDAQKSAVPIKPYKASSSLNADVIVDALLGSGLQGEVRAPYTEIIKAINAQKSPVVALDVPSGINVDHGSVQGSAVCATLTITFIANKRGLFTHKAPAYCGEIIMHDLNIPKSVFDRFPAQTQMIDPSMLKSLLPKRRRDLHKGDCGHVLVVGGDYGMGGAVRMAAEAAMRVGAGLVTVATRPEHISVVSGARPEIMCREVADPVQLDDLLPRINVIIMGPGLGQTDWAQALQEKLSRVDLPKVVDADSLNLLSQSPQARNDWVLTPHPGEAARLLGWNCQTVQEDRFTAIEQLQHRYGGVMVLKGVGTLVQDSQSQVHLCGVGNPGMASGGMGDILSGVLGGLLAQGLSLDAAAQAGVLIHAMAADLAALEGGERGLLATDLLKHLRKLVNPN